MIYNLILNKNFNYLIIYIYLTLLKNYLNILESYK